MSDDDKNIHLHLGRAAGHLLDYLIEVDPEVPMDIDQKIKDKIFRILLEKIELRFGDGWVFLRVNEIKREIRKEEKRLKG